MHLRTSRIPSDVAIIGAGPAGLACAIASARHGLHVEVIDAMKPPIDKACGEGLMPNSLEALAAIGFPDLDRILGEIENHPLRGIRFIGDPASPNPVTTEAAFPRSPGRGIRRTVLHQILLDRAVSLGVRFHWENSVQSIAPIPEGTLVHSNRQTLRARYLIGADGPCSRVATWAGLTEASVQSRRIGLRQHYTVAPWTDFVEVYWSNHGQAYVTPNSSNEVCVAFIANKKFPSSEAALSHFPALRHHLALSQPNGPARGSITLGRKLRRVTKGNIALIGDASGSVDAVTGEGMALCFRQAAALSDALLTNNLGLYQQAHRRIQRLPTMMSRSLLLMDRSPRLRDTVLRAFQRTPWLFERLLQMHIGQSPLQSFTSERLPVLTG
ncbi:MAG TPA: NAD(P)/FAD-dependent oxidoreductase [Edaphobacter sp.]|nr:NAD(P)/FAD-dependent oxidoreductase [Edaphobacter sp.]